MESLLYGELVPFYYLLDPTDGHREEAATYIAALRRPGAQTLLDLGAGAGNNASFLKHHFRCTLADISEPMQGLSRELNPECEHVLGDMRTLRLGRTFDAVLVHDAIMYMTSEQDLRAAVQTAFEHTAKGGVAVFAPDVYRETFEESHDVHAMDDGDRGLRCLEWMRDPDPNDSTMTVDYAFLLREGPRVRAVHDQHIEGLFSRDTWVKILSGAGYRVEIIERDIGDGEHDEIFRCVRPS